MLGNIIRQIAADDQVKAMAEEALRHSGAEVAVVDQDSAEFKYRREVECGPSSLLLP